MDSSHEERGGMPQSVENETRNNPSPIVTESGAVPYHLLVKALLRLLERRREARKEEAA